MEPAETPGGHSRLSTGLVMASGSALHTAAGVTDSPDSFLRDYLNVVRQGVAPGPVRSYVDNSGATVDWLVQHGVRFHPRPVHGGNATVPRALVAEGFGAGMMSALWTAARRAGVDIALRHRALRLLRAGDRVVGALVQTPAGEQQVHARAVVLATGGFGANPELLTEHYPASNAVGDWLWNIGHEHNRGDGLVMAREIGAPAVGHDRGLRVLHADFVRTLEATIPGWVVLVDGDGRRFVDETSQYGMVAHRTGAVGERAWAVLDARALDRPVDDRTTDYLQEIPGIAQRRSVNFAPAVLREHCAAGRIPTADTLTELAAAVGLPAAQLVATIGQYNEGAQAGRDRFGKRADCLRAVDTAPYLAVEVRPASLVYTAYGPQIDENACLLDELGGPVPGLFAAGEVTGGVLGDLYVGSGSGLGTAGTLGRTAGESAAAYAAYAAYAASAPGTAPNPS